MTRQAILQALWALDLHQSATIAGKRVERAYTPYRAFHVEGHGNAILLSHEAVTALLEPVQ